MQSAPCQLAKKAFHKSTPPQTKQDARLFRMHPATSGGAPRKHTTAMSCASACCSLSQVAKCESTFAPTPSPMGAVVRRTCFRECIGPAGRGVQYVQPIALQRVDARNAPTTFMREMECGNCFWWHSPPGIGGGGRRRRGANSSPTSIWTHTLCHTPINQ